MHLKTSLLVVALCASASFLLPACSTVDPTASTGGANTTTGTYADSYKPNPMGGVVNGSEGSARIQGMPGQTQGDLSVYQKRGMEISAITARMADSLQQSMFYYLLPDAPADPSSVEANVKIVTMPRIAITSFVDTDTYENAGYLGRALAEFFTNEMTNRAFEVTDYKLTGTLSVTNDGDFILSRNWRKIAKDTKVKYLLGGTITRNDNGVVLVARMVNMQTRQIIAAATDFIPYSLLPSCYRSKAIRCEFEGQGGYLGIEQIRDANYYKARAEAAEAKLNALKQPTPLDAERYAAQRALTRAQVRSSSGQPLGGVFVADSLPPYPTGAVVSTYQAPASAPLPDVPPSQQAAANQYYSPSTAPASNPTVNTKAVPTYQEYLLNTGASANVSAGGSQGANYSTPNGAPSAAPANYAAPAGVTSFGEPVYVRQDPRFHGHIIQGATSRGNYDDYRNSLDQSSFVGGCGFGGCNDPVVYPSNTYMHNTLIVRDTADESSYDRTK